MDEADRLLEQGCTDFTKDLETIMSILPAKRQTLLFSATLTDTLQELKNIAMNKPFFWESKSESVTFAVYWNIKQWILVLGDIEFVKAFTLHHLA